VECYEHGRWARLYTDRDLLSGMPSSRALSKRMEVSALPCSWLTGVSRGQGSVPQKCGSGHTTPAFYAPGTVRSENSTRPQYRVAEAHSACRANDPDTSSLPLLATSIGQRLVWGSGGRRSWHLRFPMKRLRRGV
jgi:hypothetical protein